MNATVTQQIEARLRDMTPADVYVLSDKVKEDRGLGLKPLDPKSVRKK
jgi:hypothetical protein